MAKTNYLHRGLTVRSKVLAVALVSVLSAFTFGAAAKDFRVNSPDGSLTVTVEVGDEVTWSLFKNGNTLISPSAISMTLQDGTVYGASGKFSTIKGTEQDNNSLTFKFSEYDLIFKVFDEGAAYRFVSKCDKSFNIVDERATFTLPEDWTMYTGYVRYSDIPIEKQFGSSCENHYSHIRVSEWDPGRIAFLPVLVEAPNGVKLCITETDLTDYAGMYLYNGDGSTTLTGIFPAYPKDLKLEGHSMKVHGREDYIAKYDGATAFPWRVVAVSSEDRDLLANTLTYKLGPDQEPGADFSWVKPGKVAWDFWNNWNLTDVDFRTGVNNDTYKYYIDFASKNGIEYIIMDEGWYVGGSADLMQVVPEIDLRELVDYGRERGVGIILWAGYWAFDRDMENVCRHYSEMGIKGFKVDFMCRDDQFMVNFHKRAAEVAAKYHLLIDFHGTFKPVGLHKAFPNVINYEGVYGLEHMCSDYKTDQVPYDVTIPFVRMVAGPLDYTQGAMRNASAESYRAVRDEPMSQGTRCRQLAEYVVFDSPLAMLCDSPSAYMREPECTEFIAACPTVWDEVVPVAGEVAKYVAVAKRSGETWYVGAMTDWDGRDVDIDLSFLGSGKWNVELFRDGVNADRIARDYRREEFAVDVDTQAVFTVHLAPGGGAAAVFRR